MNWNGSSSFYSEQIMIEDDWESLISQGLEEREKRDQSQWKLGELADRVNIRYGKDSIGIFAASIGINKASLLRYRDVYRKFKDKEINPAISFSHHLKASGSEDPEKWLEKAYEGNWSVEKLGLEISLTKEKDDTYRKCPVCGGYQHPVCSCASKNNDD